MDADRHPWLEHPVVPRAIPVTRMRDPRLLVDHPHTVGNAGIEGVAEFSGHGPGPRAEFAKAQARTKQVEIVLELVSGKAVEPTLLRCHPCPAAKERARDVRAIAVGADHISVECDK